MFICMCSCVHVKTIKSLTVMVTMYIVHVHVHVHVNFVSVNAMCTLNYNCTIQIHVCTSVYIIHVTVLYVQEEDYFLFIPHLSSTTSPQTVVQLSVHLASMLLDLTVAFLTRILQAGATPEALKALSSSFLISKLLPNVLAQLGTIASQQPDVWRISLTFFYCF